MKKHNQSLKAQCERLLKQLQQGPLTTIQARHSLDILGVAPRVFELRHHYGHNIETQWIESDNPGGGRHRVALYVLRPGKWKRRGITNE